MTTQETITASPQGWIVPVTHRIGDCLETGGVAGRVELWTRKALWDIGIPDDATPDMVVDLADGPAATYADYLYARRSDYLGSDPYGHNRRDTVRVLTRGNQIR
jgi:hypothetical protein